MMAFSAVKPNVRPTVNSKSFIGKRKSFFIFAEFKHTLPAKRKHYIFLGEIMLGLQYFAALRNELDNRINNNSDCLFSHQSLGQATLQWRK